MTFYVNFCLIMCNKIVVRSLYLLMNQYIIHRDLGWKLVKLFIMVMEEI